MGDEESVLQPLSRSACSLQRAFVSEPEIPRQKWNILKRFGIFYLCNGRPVTGHSHAHTSGAWRRSFGRRNVRLRAGRCKDKKIQNVSEYSVFAMESLVLRRTLSRFADSRILLTEIYDALPDDLLRGIACRAIYARDHGYFTRQSLRVFF